MRRQAWITAALLISGALGGWIYQKRLGPDDGRRPSSSAQPLPGAALRPDVLERETTPHRLASDSLLAREARAAVFGRFDSWAAGCLAETDPDARRASLAAGIAAATARRGTLRDLIAADPEQALRHAVPWGVRAALPAEILPLLEDRVDGIGAYHALAAIAPGRAAGDDGGFVAARRQVEIDGRVYAAFTYGRRLELGSRARLAIHGIAVDGRLALSDSPLRPLDAGEPIPAGRTIVETCSVSGRPTDAASAPVAADTGDRIIYLCSAGHIGALAASLESVERAGGDSSEGATAVDEVLAAGTGSRRVLMIRVRFADQPAWFTPESDASATAIFAATDAFYSENSSGALAIEGTVSPVYTLPQTAAWYSANDTSGYALNVLNAARAVAADPASAPGNEGLAAHNYLEYDFEAVRYTTGPGVFSGQGYVAARGCWVKSPDAGVLIHELGHNLGLWHANAWAPADPLVPLGAGTNAEYGDQFDTMGPARGGAWHFNSWGKRRLGWLASGDVAAVSSSTTLTLAAHDLGTVPVGRVRALRITRDSDRDYWVEVRRHPGWLAQRPGVHDGVTIRWDPWARSNGGTQLLDATPGSAEGRDDATLALGRTYSDAAAGIHITPIAVNSADPTAFDVDIRLGSFPGNRRPVVSIAASAADVAPGVPVQFSATGIDPDGDALSFCWSFDESTATSSGASVTQTWSVLGDHRARVTVSDRRGGQTSATVIVRVGESAGSRIHGRVLDLDGQPIGGVLVHNGTEPGADGYRTAWSDGDGSFTLIGVPQGTWQLAATAPGWMFATDGFSHPVVTPGDSSGVTLRGYWKGFSISGALRRADGTALAGATVRLAGRVEPTDAHGEFSITGLAPGRHVLEVDAAGAIFDPATVELGLADVTDLLLTEKTYTLSGTVSAPTAATVTVTTGWQSTTVNVSSASVATPVRFALPGVSGGDWALRAVSTAATFPPQEIAAPAAVGSELPGLAFIAEASPHYAIGGIVRDRGIGLAGATVSAGGVTTTTDSRGAYWLHGLAVGVQEVGVSLPGRTFSPATRSVEITTTHIANIDFATDRTNAAPTFTTEPHPIGSLSRPFITLTAAATDDDGAGLLRYWWSVIGDAPGDVSFAATGANAAGTTVVRFSAPGSYRIRVSVTDLHGAVESSDVLVKVSGEVGPPVIVEAARADPAVVGSELATTLSVRASSDSGDDQLTYTWTVDAGAPGPVGFSTNSSSSARETAARFRAPGNYLVRVTVRDPAGRAVESSVAVRVELTYASWLSGHFDAAVVADTSLRPGFWGELADPDGDGVVNLLEYAFGGDPMVAAPDTRPQTHFVKVDGVEYLAVTFRPNPDAIDLLFEPQLSSDLESWQGGAVFVPGPDERVLTYRDFAPASAHQRRFIRINVSQPLR